MFGPGDREARTHRAELEFVAGKCEGARAVTVAGIAGQPRQHADAHLHVPALAGALEVGALQLIHHVLKLIAQEDRDDGRRGLVGAEPVIVAGARHRDAQKFRVLRHRADDRDAEDEELRVVVRVVAGVEQVLALVGGHRPVVVLARAVDAGEGLLVQQADEAVLLGGAAHHVHAQLVVVGREVRVLEDRCDLVLARRHLVVPGLDGDAELEHLGLAVGHARENPLRDGAEVLVLEFLPLRRLRAKERPPAVRADRAGHKGSSCRSGSIPAPARRW